MLIALLLSCHWPGLHKPYKREAHICVAKRGCYRVDQTAEGDQPFRAQERSRQVFCLELVGEQR